ncbi:hypothetical protein XhyaCFBP1156_07255 [Xanthomonas hyacinthi]|uniref:Uncharacterized protein n=2 Tax=Xanthomonas hyacinthi TaxID=56455 RepID=A0A2S7EZM7_9XANT|nr:hypothetical protein Y886_01985 [Xanthomonas hyacinthi DSM 19077]PPU98502.1 hypothetical protein XhyaCFBP1156_07255 [Xanthomonas hyacinthi]
MGLQFGTAANERAVDRRASFELALFVKVRRCVEANTDDGIQVFQTVTVGLQPARKIVVLND